MVEVAQVVGQYWLFLLLPLAAALAIAAAALYMLKRGRRLPAAEEEMERAKERLSAMVRERTAFLERANEELARSEEKYRTMIENSNDMIWTLDSQANFTYFNRRSEEISGYGLGELKGRSFAPLIPKADLPRIQKVFVETMAGKPTTYEVSFYAKDGRLVSLSVNSAPLYEAGKVVGTASFGQDITERKRAEEQLRESEERYRTVIDTSNDLIWFLDVEGKVTYVNRKAEEIGDFTLEEVKGKHFSLRVPEEDIPKLQKIFTDTVSGHPTTYESSFYAKDGTKISVSVNTAPIYLAGKIVGVASFGQDITEKKRAAELLENYADRLEAEVKNRTAELSAEKDKVEALLAMKDEFIRNVSHELKTPLSVIIGNLILLKGIAPAGKGKEWSRMVELLERNAKRLGNSIDNVLELSIVSTEEAGREKVYMKDLLNGIYGQYAPVAALKGLKLTLDAEQLMVDGDAKMLRLAIANLVDNALKFTEKGSVGIALKAADGSVSVSVKDTGAGISAKDQKRLFEKFFKADPSAPGTGIGLAIAKEIVNKHNGEIRVKSALGKGSTFEIILPRGAGK